MCVGCGGGTMWPRGGRVCEHRGTSGAVRVCPRARAAPGGAHARLPVEQHNLRRPGRRRSGVRRRRRLRCARFPRPRAQPPRRATRMMSSITRHAMMASWPPMPLLMMTCTEVSEGGGRTRRHTCRQASPLRAALSAGLRGGAGRGGRRRTCELLLRCGQPVGGSVHILLQVVDHLPLLVQLLTNRLWWRPNNKRGAGGGGGGGARQRRTRRRRRATGV